MATQDSTSLRVKHGHCANKSRSPTYRCWRSMMQRCYREKEKTYSYYGAKGIKVCDRWHDFVNFLFDMGEVPVGLEIDRIDSKGNYEPGNCRWATQSQQARNKRNTAMFTYNGMTKPIADWADECGLKCKTLKKRIRDGWKFSDAISVPLLTIKEVSMRGHAARKWAKEISAR